MYSYRSFTPGASKGTSRMIHYVAEHNAIFPKSTLLNCYCVPNKYDKNTPGYDSPSVKQSYNSRISFIINNTKGGKSQYGNLYLGEPLNVNYLGRVEGMSGGSGSPPVNRF